MKKRQAFENVLSKEDLLDTLNENIDYLTNGYLNEDVCSNVLVRIASLDKEEESEVLNFLHYVDRKLNFAGQGSFNKRHKLPTIISGTNYILNYKSRIKDLSLEEFMVLSKLSIIEEESRYNEILDVYTKDILKEVVSRDKRYGFADFFLTIVEKYHELGFSEKEIIDYLQSHSNDELIKESIAYDDEILRKLGYR